MIPPAIRRAISKNHYTHWTRPPGPDYPGPGSGCSVHWESWNYSDKSGQNA